MLYKKPLFLRETARGPAIRSFGINDYYVLTSYKTLINHRLSLLEIYPMLIT